MGSGIYAVCPHCKHNTEEFLIGIGFRYVEVRNQCRKDIESNSELANLKTALHSTEGAYVNASYVVFQCEKCGELESLLDYSIEVDVPLTELEKEAFPCWWPLKTKPKVVQTYCPTCKQCGKKMHRCDAPPKCPACGKEMEWKDAKVLWD